MAQIVLNRAAVRDLLRSPKVAAEIARRAQAIANAADAASGRSGDHTVDSEIGRNRARSAVYTETFNAMHREADSRTLTRSIDAGRR